MSENQTVAEKVEEKVAMVIMAHPDDAEFGSAGTVAQWVQEGWTVYYVICSDGSGGGSDEARDVGLAARREISQTRQREQNNAAEILGVKEVIFLNYPDGQLEPTLALRRDIVRVLRRYKPLRVICQSPERSWTPVMPIPRYHPDHLAAGVAALAAIYPASQNPWDFPELLEEGLEPHRVREVFIMGAPHANFCVDITATLDKKILALKAHVSQHQKFEETEQRVRGWATMLGQKYNLTAAEEFHRTEN